MTCSGGSSCCGMLESICLAPLLPSVPLPPIGIPLRPLPLAIERFQPSLKKIVVKQYAIGQKINVDEITTLQ